VSRVVELPFPQIANVFLINIRARIFLHFFTLCADIKKNACPNIEKKLETKKKIWEEGIIQITICISAKVLECARAARQGRFAIFGGL